MKLKLNGLIMVLFSFVGVPNPTRCLAFPLFPLATFREEQGVFLVFEEPEDSTNGFVERKSDFGLHKCHREVWRLFKILLIARIFLLLG